VRDEQRDGDGQRGGDQQRGRGRQQRAEQQRPDVQDDAIALFPDVLGVGPQRRPGLGDQERRDPREDDEDEDAGTGRRAGEYAIPGPLRRSPAARLGGGGGHLVPFLPWWRAAAPAQVLLWLLYRTAIRCARDA
jgi:hypothetical protein